MRLLIFGYTHNYRGLYVVTFCSLLFPGNATVVGVTVGITILLIVIIIVVVVIVVVVAKRRRSHTYGFDITLLSVLLIQFCDAITD